MPLTLVELFCPLLILTPVVCQQSHLVVHLALITEAIAACMTVLKVAQICIDAISMSGPALSSAAACQAQLAVALGEQSCSDQACTQKSCPKQHGQQP